jgi:hypothetical protein
MVRGACGGVAVVAAGRDPSAERLRVLVGVKGEGSGNLWFGGVNSSSVIAGARFFER